MHYMALASDYDGTLAENGIVAEETLAALQRFKKSGRKLLLVTGRELPELQNLFPAIDVFDLVVAENGALLFDPASGVETLLADPAPEEFIARIGALGVRPVSVGRCIVATWEPHETAVLEAIKELGLELQITFNKGAVMVLPTGINKASGLDAALDMLGLAAAQVVAVGDAENDHAFLHASGCGVAVANALQAVKETADIVTRGARGEGVVELIDALLAHDVDVVAHFAKPVTGDLA